MKIFVFSDIHGDVAALKRVLCVINEVNPTHIVCLGDCLYHGPRNEILDSYNPKECVDLIKSLKPRLTIVRGNCDSKVDETVLSEEMQNYKVMNVGNRRVIFFHGDDVNNLDFELVQNDVILHGHTHVAKIDKNNMFIVANPGSISLPRNKSKKGYIVIDKDCLCLYNLDSSDLINSIEL